jgi:mannose-6-phosphate isomerase-like protein (cupin superfamily)
VIHAGQVLAYAGLHLTFLHTAQDTGGAATVIDLVVAPHTTTGGDLAHVHVAAEERYTVLEGTLAVWIGTPRQMRTVGPGAAVVLPRGVAHRHWNATPAQAVHVIEELRPAGNTELALEAALGLIRDGKTTKRGVPRNVLEAALLLHLAGTVPAGPPVALSTTLVRALALLARRRGYAPHFPQYTGARGLLAPVY